MRAALSEYNYDWTLYAMFSTAANTLNGSRKEYERMLPRVSTFRGIIEPVMATGEPGKLFLQGMGEYLRRVVNAHQEGKKLCLTTFCQAPALFWAMDIVPILLEPMTVAGTLVHKGGTSEFMDYCVEKGFTETSCSSQRGALGAYLCGLAEPPDMVVIDTPGICDTNANSFSFFAAHENIPFYQLNYPPELTADRSREYHRKDYRNLIAFLEEQTGKKLDPQRLAGVIAEMEKQDRLICDIQDLQRVVPSPVPIIYNFFIYALRFTMGGRKEATDMLAAMLECAMDNAANGRSGFLSGEERARGLFVYIDHYSMNLPLWMFLEEKGITHLGGILDRFYQARAPYAGDAGYSLSMDSLDAMIDTLADANSRLPMVKQIRGPYDARDMWLEEALSLAKLYNADFAVYSGTPGCRNTWGMVKLLARDLEKAGIPTLVLNSDAFDDRVESWSNTKHRIEEFLEVRRIAG
ncbi:MAG: 2-hydroxyacyl-CoA dehydratase [Deltaproteobacteria bacterium]|nr:2-hydroxyacyl-CoA dehydratase [Deltaproteobacteria bacterium]